MAYHVGARHGQGRDRAKVAVVSVTTSGLVTKPPNSSLIKDSMSSTRPSRAGSSIIWVPEYESMSLRYSEAL